MTQTPKRRGTITTWHLLRSPKIFLLHFRLIYMLSLLCVRLTIELKVGIPESFKVGWYRHKITGSSHLKTLELLIDSVHKYLRCVWYTLSWLSTLIPSRSILSYSSITISFATKQNPHFLLPNTIVWNFFGLAIKPFSLNQLTTTVNSLSSLLLSATCSVSEQYNCRSSA